MSHSSYCYCRECLNMNLNDRNKYDKEEAYCTHYCKYYNPNSKACENHFEERNKTISSCYLTTMICKILNEDDNCELLNKMRLFRDNYLQKNEEFFSILYEYDQIGPIISKKLEENNFKNIISFMMKELYLKPIIIDINNEEYNKAIEKYKKMTIELKQLLNVEEITIKKKISKK